jgi:hypothetical protein
MTKEGKKNKSRSGRARNQRRDPSSGRFTRASAASGTDASVEGVPPGEATGGIENMVPDVPPGFETVTPKGDAVPHPHRPSTRFNLWLFQFILVNYCNK